jgi:high-affinity nickel permease
LVRYLLLDEIFTADDSATCGAATMGLDIAIFPMLALALGFKHAYDADHLVAVSNFLTRSGGIRETFRMSISWAIGHMTTAAVITVALFFLIFQTGSIAGLLSSLEPGVAVMLIVIGMSTILLELPLAHSHQHSHSDGTIHSHSHRHRFGGLGRFARKPHLHHPLLGIGIIHGLASNDELFLLFVSGMGVGSLEILLGGVAVFTVGVILGMLFFGFVVTSLYRRGLTRIRVVINLSVASISIGYGLLILTGSGGFNLLDIFIR